MDFIKTFEQFMNEKADSVNEGRVTYKRRYTENHPARTMNANTRIRSKILERIADGIITEDELKGLLKELNANPRWFKRNSSLFKVSENGIKLSKTGRRMFGKIQVANPVNEEEPVTESFIKTYDEFVNEGFLANPHDAAEHVLSNYKKITGSKFNPKEMPEKDAGKIERFVKKQKIKVDDFWEEWINLTSLKESYSAVNESMTKELTMIAMEAGNYNKFKKEAKKIINKTPGDWSDKKEEESFYKDVYDLAMDLKEMIEDAE